MIDEVPPERALAEARQQLALEGCQLQLLDIPLGAKRTLCEALLAAISDEELNNDDYKDQDPSGHHLPSPQGHDFLSWHEVGL